MREELTRRDWLVLSGLAAGAMAVRPAAGRQAVPAGPVEPVSVAKVRSYDEDLTTRFRQMFDQIGEIENQVKGKTVGIKVNLTGDGRFPGYTSGDTHWVHPAWWARPLRPSVQSELAAPSNLLQAAKVTAPEYHPRLPLEGYGTF